MSLSQALASAMSGLRANQIGLGLVSSNIANAETTGYIRKTANQVAISSGEFGASVRVASVNRELDQYLQRQLRTETSGAAYANVRAEAHAPSGASRRSRRTSTIAAVSVALPRAIA